jgi:hypothetical protein
MESGSIIALLGFGGTLLLVMTGLLNFSVFIRQLKASREQLETARQQLEHAQQQPAILLIQRAMAESSEHLKMLIEHPHLRPYFYENRKWTVEDAATLDEVKLMAELILNTFASSLIHAAAFPQYPARTVEQTIRFHMSSSAIMCDYLMEAFDRFPVAGLALLVLKGRGKDDVEADLRSLVDTAPNAEERARRQHLLEYLRTAESVDPLDLTRYTLNQVGSLEAPAV